MIKLWALEAVFDNIPVSYCCANKRQMKGKDKGRP